MVELKRILVPDDVAVGLVCNTKEDAIMYAVSLMAKNHGLANPLIVQNAMIEREKLASTGIGEGIAVPHGLCEGLTETCMTVLRLDTPIEFGAPDGKPVDLLFCITGPKENSTFHLQLLSKLARLLHNAQFRDSLRQASSSKELWEQILSQD